MRVAQLASLIAAEEGADPARAALLAIWHDSQETRTGDIPHTARPYLAARIDPETVTADQVAGLPEAAAKTVQETVAEYEAQATPEARLRAGCGQAGVPDPGRRIPSRRQYGRGGVDHLVPGGDPDAHGGAHR
jgi:hypothetical protein